MATRRRTPGTVSRGDQPGPVLTADDALAGPRELVINAAWNALTYVCGPAGLDIVSLGLVYDVRDEAGVIVVEMASAAPGSPAGERLHELAGAAVAEAVGGAAAAKVRVVRDPPWSPAMIDTIAAEAAGGS